MPDLTRFHDAQSGTFETALAELREGQKRSHWMWFVFPQLRRLGRSPTAQHYGIEDLAEARGYLAKALLLHADNEAARIMGHTDALKLRSSATLFRAAGGGPEFQAILDTFYGGAPCSLTEAELVGGSDPV